MNVSKWLAPYSLVLPSCACGVTVCPARLTLLLCAACDGDAVPGGGRDQSGHGSHQ